MRGLLSRNPRARLLASAAWEWEWAGEAATGVRSAGSAASRGWYAVTSGRVHSIEMAAQRRPFRIRRQRCVPLLDRAIAIFTGVEEKEVEQFSSYLDKIDR
jgi:hypothetical protein